MALWKLRCTFNFLETKRQAQSTRVAGGNTFALRINAIFRLSPKYHSIFVGADCRTFGLLAVQQCELRKTRYQSVGLGASRRLLNSVFLWEDDLEGCAVLVTERDVAVDLVCQNHNNLGSH